MARARLIALIVGTVVGAAAGALALLVSYSVSPAVRLEMDRDLPGATRGFFPVERGGGKSFAWTGRTAEIGWPRLDRRVPWACTVSLLGWRPATAPLPAVSFAADGVEVLTWTVSGGNDDVRFEVPARPEGAGLVLALAVSGTFRPADDPRDLGVAVDRISCQPAAGRLAMAPWPALGRAALSAAILGAALGAIGLTWPIAAAGALLVSVAQAAPLTVGMAPYLAGRPPGVPLSTGFAIAIAVLVAALDMLRRERLSGSARIAVALSAVLCYLKLLVLLHPDMPTMDAMFQAHRLEWVLSGRYYFTSLTPDGYLFPYGISLYLVAAPFASLVPDHVALLRGVVCIADMLAGLSLYAIVSRTWHDRAAGVLAVVLFHTTPIAAAVVGTGNLTNAFGESVALLTVATVVSLPLTWSVWIWLSVPMLVASVAFIAHFSTFMVLAVTLCAIGLIYYIVGGPALQRAASSVLMGLGLAVALSVLLFYGHFWSTYRSQATRLAGDVKTIVSADQEKIGQAPQLSPAPAPPQPQTTPQTVRRAPPRQRPSPMDRLSTLGRRTWTAYGWLLPAIATLGLVLLIKRRGRDRLSLAIAGWLVTLLGCSALAVFTPLELRYQLAVAPALAILGGFATAAWWRAGGWRRWTVAAILAMIAFAGTRNWFDWIL
jgi:hypothetical protein